MALASTEVPSEALTITRQVMRSEFVFNPTAVLEAIALSVALVGVVEGGLSWFSTCSKVW